MPCRPSERTREKRGERSEEGRDRMSLDEWQCGEEDELQIYCNCSELDTPGNNSRHIMSYTLMHLTVEAITNGLRAERVRGHLEGCGDGGEKLSHLAVAGGHGHFLHAVHDVAHVAAVKRDGGFLEV
jgi:hypothetical protein